MIFLYEKLNLCKYTLILPSVAVGNVAQLSIDLLISTLNLKRIGRILDTCFVPLVGRNPYDKTRKDICSSIDIYASEEKKIVTLQLRTPIIKNASYFFFNILNFVTKYKILEVVILTSSFKYDKSNDQIKTNSIQYLTTKNISLEFKQIDGLLWKETKSYFVDDFNSGTISKIHGGGFAKRIFNLLKKHNIDCVILIKLCSEGDNISDAIELIKYLNCCLELVKINNGNNCILKFPPSWNFLFGNYSSKELY